MIAGYFADLGGEAVARQANAGSSAALANETSGPAAEPFSTKRLAALRSQGHPVFVNFTAAWCITCKVNEQVALKSDELARVFKDHGVTYLIGDWTRQDAEITAVLRRYNRAGVPLYLLFPADSAKDAHVLPQVLTLDLIRRSVVANAPRLAAKAD